MTTIQRMKNKRRTVGYIMANAHLTQAKASILDGYGVERIRDLSEDYLDHLIGRLRKLQPGQDAAKNIREWRHKCLRMMTECGIDTQNWNEVNSFMLNKKICGKHLYELNVSELSCLHRKLHNVRDNKQKKAAEFQRLSLNN